MVWFGYHHKKILGYIDYCSTPKSRKQLSHLCVQSEHGVYITWSHTSVESREESNL